MRIIKVLSHEDANYEDVVRHVFENAPRVIPMIVYTVLAKPFFGGARTLEVSIIGDAIQWLDTGERLGYSEQIALHDQIRAYRGRAARFKAAGL